MNKLFKTLFSSSKAKSTFGQSSLLHSRSDLASVQDGSENAVRQQLIQTLHRDLMRKHGIPLEWMACHTQVMVSRSKGTGMSAVLVVKHWDERLMNHAFALQRTLALNVVEFEPAAEKWLQGITWRLDVANSCPHIDLPEKSFWNDQYTPAPTAFAASAQKAELAAAKNEWAALNAAYQDAQSQLAQHQAELQTQTTHRAEQAAQLATLKQELAASQAERAHALGGAQRPAQPTQPAQRTQFMPNKAASADTSGAASPGVSPPDDSQARNDLDRLFAIRDTALRGSSGAATPARDSKPQGQVAAGYEPTQPAPLRR